MKYCPNDDELALISSFRAGNESAFDSLVELYTPMMKRVALSMSLDFDETFSDACIAFYRAAQTYDLSQSEVSFGLYAQICVTRKLCDVIRRCAGEEIVSDLDVDAIAVDSGIVSRLVRREELHELRNNARRVLSDYEFRVLVLWLGGDETADIALALDTTPKSVDNAKARILKKLRRSMSEQ